MLASVAPFVAQPATTGTDPLEGHIRDGGGFGCRKLVPPRLSPEAWLAALPWLRFGPLALGMTPAPADELIAHPFRAIDIGRGALARFYFFGADRQRPYIVVVVRNDQSVTLQMTCILRDPHCVFSGIAPGMPQTGLDERFRPPFSRKPVAAVSSEFGRYGPYPFTFEVRDAEVFSVRISLDKAN